MINPPDVRAQHWSLLINRLYRDAKEKDEIATYKDFGDLLNVSDVTIGKWLKGGFCDDINIWVAVSEYSGMSIAEMKDFVYGISVAQKSRVGEDLGELSALAYLKSAPIAQVIRFAKASIELAEYEIIHKESTHALTVVSKPALDTNMVSTGASMNDPQKLNVFIRSILAIRNDTETLLLMIAPNCQERLRAAINNKIAIESIDDVFEHQLSDALRRFLEDERYSVG